MTYFSEFDDFDPPRRSLRRRVVGWLAFLLFASGILAAVYLPTPYVIERPGPAFNVLGQQGGNRIISVSGAKSYDADGALQLLTVSILGSPKSTPSWFELGMAWLDPAQNIVPLDAIYPPNQTDSQTQQQSLVLMKSSQEQAIAAALQAPGYQLSAKVIVVGYGTDSPAKGLLELGDQVLKIDGTKVKDVDGMRSLVAATQGKAVSVSVLRDGQTVTLELTPKLVDGDWRFGILAEQQFVFPVDVSLQLENVGGPSGGMIFALGVYDTLTPGSLTGGQVIAGTGTIDASGTVGNIGGIRQKMFSALCAGAKWFLAPAGNCDQVVGHIPHGLSVVKVENFGQALKAVQQIAKNHSAAGLPTCGAVR